MAFGVGDAAGTLAEGARGRRLRVVAAPPPSGNVWLSEICNFVEEFEISVAPPPKAERAPAAARSLVCTTPQNRIMSNAGSVCVFVTVKIKQDRIDDFLAAMKIDVEGTRKEEGCIKFDLLKGEGDGVYHFYEVYKDSNAAAVHKETAHYKAWADFKASGGVESQEVAKASGVDVQ